MVEQNLKPSNQETCEKHRFCKSEYPDNYTSVNSDINRSHQINFACRSNGVSLNHSCKWEVRLFTNWSGLTNRLCINSYADIRFLCALSDSPSWSWNSYPLMCKRYVSGVLLYIFLQRFRTKEGDAECMV